MSFILVGLFLLTAVFAFVAVGIIKNAPKKRGGVIPSLPDDLIHAMLSPGGQYQKLPNGDFLKVGELPQ